MVRRLHSFEGQGGADGVSRVLDFGVAKAAGRIQTTREGQLKGKLAYMAVEQLRGGQVDRRTDVYAAGVVLWEALTMQRLFTADNEPAVMTEVLERVVPPPSSEGDAPTVTASSAPAGRERRCGLVARRLGRPGRSGCQSEVAFAHVM